jgi:hypothetical protein
VYCRHVCRVILVLIAIIRGLTRLLISLGLCIAPCLSIRQNPLISGFNPDPSPICVEGWYYLATSSFEYFPGIPIYRSRNLSNWDLFSHALTRPSQLQLYGVPTAAGKSSQTPLLQSERKIVKLRHIFSAPRHHIDPSDPTKARGLPPCPTPTAPSTSHP